jgi:hypothetical protein
VPVSSDLHAKVRKIAAADDLPLSTTARRLLSMAVAIEFEKRRSDSALLQELR